MIILGKGIWASLKSTTFSIGRKLPNRLWNRLDNKEGPRYLKATDEYITATFENKGITLSLIYLCDLSPLKVTRAKITAKILHSPER